MQHCMRYLYYLVNAETKCLYTQTPIVSLHAVIWILLIIKLGLLENHCHILIQLVLATKLEKEDDEDDGNDDDDDDDNDPDGLETSARSLQDKV